MGISPSGFMAKTHDKGLKPAMDRLCFCQSFVSAVIGILPGVFLSVWRPGFFLRWVSRS